MSDVLSCIVFEFCECTSVILGGNSIYKIFMTVVHDDKNIL